MIRRDGARLVLDGAVTMVTHVAMRAAAMPLLEDATEVDWSAVEQVDSSALSLVLAWRREGRRLTQQNLPAGLIALAELYGVNDLLAP